MTTRAQLFIESFSVPLGDTNYSAVKAPLTPSNLVANQQLNKAAAPVPVDGTKKPPAHPLVYPTMTTRAQLFIESFSVPLGDTNSLHQWMCGWLPREMAPLRRT
jgi:hypothetical protein